MDEILNFEPFPPSKPSQPSKQPAPESPQQQPLHRIQEVRLQQEVSLRAAARQLGMHIPRVKLQEQETSDLRITELHRWQEVLEVPLPELLAEQDEPLSRNVRDRARMIRLMKTVHAILERAQTPAIKAMAQELVEQLLATMPELKDVSPWHDIGQRRTSKDLGRTAERQISERMLQHPSHE